MFNEKVKSSLIRELILFVFRFGSLYLSGAEFGEVI